MQTIFKKCPFKENGKLSKLFRLVLRGLNLPEGSDTPQNKILRGIRPRRTRSCRVRIRPCRKMAELCTFYSIHLFCRKSCGVSDPAEQSPVSNPAEQHLKTNISASSKKNSKIFQGVNSGTIWGRFVEKNQR
jgi:hypothetical protein